MFAKVISIGWGCQVAYQIRRILPRQREAFFFDWIITDHASLLRAIPMRFENLLSPNSLTMDPRRICIKDEGTGLCFYAHDFAGPGDGTISANYVAQATEIRDKYLRRAERTAETLNSGEPILLVRHGYDVKDAVAPAQRLELFRLFASITPMQIFPFSSARNLQ